MYLALTLVPRDGAKAPPPTHTHTLKSEPELTTFNAKREPKVQAVVRASNLIALAFRPFEFRLATHVRAHSSSYVEQLGHSRSVQSFCVILPQVLVPHVPLRPYETSTLWTHNVDVADVEHSNGVNVCAWRQSVLQPFCLQRAGCNRPKSVPNRRETVFWHMHGVHRRAPDCSSGLATAPQSVSLSLSGNGLRGDPSGTSSTA